MVFFCRSDMPNCRRCNIKFMYIYLKNCKNITVIFANICIFARNSKRELKPQKSEFI